MEGGLTTSNRTSSSILVLYVKSFKFATVNGIIYKINNGIIYNINNGIIYDITVLYTI